jgi:hypothetical protein
MSSLLTRCVFSALVSGCLFTVAAGHRPVPQRQNCAGRSGGCIWTRERAHVFVALCVAEHHGGATRQTWAVGFLPQGTPPQPAAVVFTLTDESCRARLTSSKEKSCTKRSAHRTFAVLSSALASYSLSCCSCCLQGSDASNAHDEEVGEHEQVSLQECVHIHQIFKNRLQEFSDDEQEMAAKVRLYLPLLLLFLAS